MGYWSNKHEFRYRYFIDLLVSKSIMGEIFRAHYLAHIARVNNLLESNRIPKMNIDLEV